MYGESAMSDYLKHEDERLRVIVMQDHFNAPPLLSDSRPIGDAAQPVGREFFVARIRNPFPDLCATL
jgi:hypothetical protein